MYDRHCTLWAFWFVLLSYASVLRSMLMCKMFPLKEFVKISILQVFSTKLIF